MATLMPRTLVMVLILCAAPRAIAAPPESRGVIAAYNRHLEEAERLRNEERYEESIDALRAAYALRPNPTLLCNQGFAFMKLGRPEEALRVYQRCAAESQETDPVRADKLLENIRRAQFEIDRRAEPPPEGWRADGTQVWIPRPTPEKPAPPERPLYKRWWFWTGLGTVVAGAVVAGAVLGTRSPDLTADPRAQTITLQF